MYNILLFGTGSGADKVLGSLRLEASRVIGFVDNNKGKWGSTWRGAEVYSPNVISELIFDYIIIASDYHVEITKQLIELNINRTKIIPFFEWVSNNSQSIDNDLFNKLFSSSQMYDIFLRANKLFFNIVFTPFSSERIDFVNKYSKKGIIFINHYYGGGSQVYQEKEIEQERIKKNRNIFMLYVFKGQLLIIDHTFPNEQPGYIKKLSELTPVAFKEIMNALNIELIYINQLVSLPVYKMVECIQFSGIPYAYFIHDFYSVCPSYNLINSKGKYCGNEQDLSICQACIQEHLHTELAIQMTSQEIDIEIWRSQMHAFLKGASKIMSPSIDTREIVLQYYPDLSIQVKEHEIEVYPYSYLEEFAYKEPLCIGFIGALNEAKGSEYVYRLVEAIQAGSLPIRVTVIGTTAKHNDRYQTQDGVLTVHGPYQREELPGLLEHYCIGIVLLPILWPETYNYTASEAISCGYPVAAFDIGAPRERIRRDQSGWVIKDQTIDGILSFIKEILADRGDIAAKAAAIMKLKGASLS